MFRLKLFANFVADSRDFVLLACEVVSSNATSKNSPRRADRNKFLDFLRDEEE